MTNLQVEQSTAIKDLAPISDNWEQGTQRLIIMPKLFAALLQACKDDCSKPKAQARNIARWRKVVHKMAQLEHMLSLTREVGNLTTNLLNITERLSSIFSAQYPLKQDYLASS